MIGDKKRAEYDSILKDQSVQDAIREYMDKSGESYDRTIEKGYDCFCEMRNDKSDFFLKVLYRIFSSFAKGSFEDFKVLNSHIQENLNKDDYSLVYAFNHLSLLDALFILYTLERKNKDMGKTGARLPLTLTSILLDFWPLSVIYRRGCSIFMRTSFKDNILYSAIFGSYLAWELNRGNPLMFFPEGKPSATGHLLPMKTGVFKILAKISEKTEKQIAFIPASIGFDRSMDLESHSRYLRNDDEKGDHSVNRSIGGLISRLLNIFKKKYGNVYISMSDPVVPKIKADFDNGDIREIAGRIREGISKATCISPMHIFAAVLSDQKNFKADELCEISEKITRFLSSLPGNSNNPFPDGDFKKHLEDCSKLDLFTWNREENIVSLTEAQSIMIRFNRNNILHILDVPSQIARFILTNGEASVEDFKDMEAETAGTILEKMVQFDLVTPGSDGKTFSSGNKLILEILGSAKNMGTCQSAN